MHYVGIDLGTTNSAIASYDGESVRLYKSPEQHDVTPSALFFDRRGNKHVGSRAYNNAARSPDNAALLFKRFMGTSTPIRLPAVERTLTPEQCSAEILRAMFGYLPEEIRDNPDLGSVITVPAAFNQMQKDATMEAAESAGIGRVALMQEPVAAVMSVVREHGVDGMFLVYDLGGGTLDIAIAESISGRVSILSHGGIPMCGGRDFDRRLYSNVVLPWLLENFDLPRSPQDDPQLKALKSIALWATEKAKIELSQRETATVTLSETEVGMRDRSGEEIYLEVPLTRGQLDRLIDEPVADSIGAARAAIEKAGVTPNDIERIAFIGGPTHYKPLQDRVAFELGIAASSGVNPMTAVAEGAAVFAEAIDWASRNRGRKSSRGSKVTSEDLGLSFDFVARTTDTRSRVVCRLGAAAIPGMEFQVDSLDTGWSSGRVPLDDGTTVDVGLAKPGENRFKLFVFDPSGGPVPLGDDQIIISRTAATVDGIPASHSISVEARERIGGPTVLDFLVREGDQLPAKGQKTFRAEESLKPGSPESLRFKLFEGEDRHDPSNNRCIGVFEIRGTDVPDGQVIPAGAELVCDYEVLDSGNLTFAASVPSIGASFPAGRYYSRQTHGVDYSTASKMVIDEADEALTRLEAIEERVEDEGISRARRRLEEARAIAPDETDPETTKKAMDDVEEARRALSEIRRRHVATIRRMELDRATAFFDENIREHARASEVSGMDNLLRTAERAIDEPGQAFESYMDEIHARNFQILWRQDWFVVQQFKWMAEDAHYFVDRAEHSRLVSAGLDALKTDDIGGLRRIVVELDRIRIGTAPGDQLARPANIVLGA